eukprot:CAMPEP_0197936698 /NCGR_PEP_ID=MMETSP1439-20131203/115373_1 /TAXON_ID=66791 /ORGANISM="Gonyaulax spinifera, Strain CCMP409" /LENGTH=60 /DNA_ID=CAMNT_0043559683 /DNA_START=77 /DNA_END=255 /DNA_ORIENTATION=+
MAMGHRSRSALLSVSALAAVALWLSTTTAFLQAGAALRGSNPGQPATAAAATAAAAAMLP